MFLKTRIFGEKKHGSHHSTRGVWSLHTNTPDKLILTFLFSLCVLFIYLLYIFVYASSSSGAYFLLFCFLCYYLHPLYQHYIFTVFVYLNTLRVLAIAFLFKRLIRLSTSTPPSHHHFTTSLYHKSPSFLFEHICTCPFLLVL